MKRFLLAGIFISILAIAEMASAVPIQLNEVGVKNAAVINGTFGGQINGTFNVLAGYYQLSIDGATAVNGFCVDPAWAPSTPQAYDLRAIDPDSIYAKAAYLFSESNPDNAAAVQVAIWETVIGSSFTPNNLTTVFKSSVDSLLLSLNQIPGTFDLGRYSIAVSPGDALSGYGIGYQDYIVEKTAPVPEPSTFLLFGVGLAGVGFLRRRMKK